MTETTSLPTSDERAMGAVAHFFGLFVALIVWASQKDRSPFLRFQAIQAVAFDAIVSLLSVILGGGLFFVVMTAALLAGLAAANSASANPDQIFLLFSLFPFLVMSLVVFLFPVFMAIFIIRLVATIKVFQGENFHYPWLGRQVEKYIGS